MKRVKTAIWIGVFTYLLIQPCFSEVIHVALEPFPPLITEEGAGFSVDMLRAIEIVSDYRFEIRQMPYNRAKIELKTGNVDLIGHTPKGMETKAFYDGDLGNLLKMLAKGRIDAFIFERASTMTTIRKYKIKNIHYKNINATLRPGFAVRKDESGSELKKTLDQLIEKVDHKRIYHSYLEYMLLPDNAIVTMPEE